MVDAVSAASPPTYTSILALDSQIRDFDVPIPLRMMDQDGDAPHPLALHQAMIACNREVGKYCSSQSLSYPRDPHTGWIRNPLTKKETLTYMFLSSLPFFLPFLQRSYSCTEITSRKNSTCATALHSNTNMLLPFSRLLRVRVILSGRSIHSIDGSQRLRSDSRRSGQIVSLQRYVEFFSYTSLLLAAKVSPQPPAVDKLPRVWRVAGMFRNGSVSPDETI